MLAALLLAACGGTTRTITFTDNKQPFHIAAGEGNHATLWAQTANST
jgi:hypothetical protein